METKNKIGSQPCNINIGDKFGKLTVLEYYGNDKHNKRLWLCKCDCGNKTLVTTSDLRRGHTTSCGCVGKAHSFKHGMTGSRIHNIWLNMRYRCRNKKDTTYKNYGARGIDICDEWYDNFQNFYEWSIDNGYTDDLTIDRIDNNGNYEPSNCRWVSFVDQQYNKRGTVHVYDKNMEYTIKDLSDITGICCNTIRTRIRRGWSVDDILKTPLGRKRNYAN